jgi:hypothetical protein
VSVDFNNAGFTKPGARYPEARGVRARPMNGEKNPDGK